MEAFKTIAVSILIVFLVLSLIGLQLILVFNGTFLKPGFYEKIGTEQEFYAQIRQLMFRLIGRSLPNGLEGLPYIEEALTESWLKDELNLLIDQFIDFIKGRKKEPPIIPIYSLKEKVAHSIDGNKTLVEKQQMVNYWFDPLPGEIRLQDFISTQIIANLRALVTRIYRILWSLIGMLVILSGLIYIVVRSWKTALLWIATAMAASGINTVLIGFAIRWILRHSTYIINIYNAIVAFEVSEESAKSLMKAFESGFTEPMILAGMLITVISGIVIYFYLYRSEVLLL